MTNKKLRKTSKLSDKFEPNKVSFGVASIGALTLLVMSILLVTSAL